MAFPSGTYLGQIRGVVLWVAEEFEQLYALLQGYLGHEHNSDGSHAAITAETLTATGAITSTSGLVTTGTATNGSVGFLAGDAVGTYGGKLLRYSSNQLFLSVPGTTVAESFSIISSTGGNIFSFYGNGQSLAAGALNLKNYTVGTLPAGTRGDIAYVTDALAPTFLAVIVGGGAVVTPVFYNGVNWIGF